MSKNNQFITGGGTTQCSYKSTYLFGGPHVVTNFSPSQHSQLEPIFFKGVETTNQYIYIYYTYIHTYLPTYLPTYIHTFIHSYIHTFIHSYIHTFIHSYIHTYIHTYIHVYVYVYVYVCMYIYIYQVEYDITKYTPTITRFHLILKQKKQ